MVNIGDTFPNILLSLRGQDVYLHDKIGDQYAVLIGTPGAFDPRASETLMPAWKLLAPELQRVGVKFIGCICVNDPFVLKGWAKKLRISTELVFISDANGSLTKALNLCASATVQNKFGGDTMRSKDFIVILSKGGGIVKIYETFEEVYSMCAVRELSVLLGVSMKESILSEASLLFDSDRDGVCVPDHQIVSDNAIPSVILNYGDCSGLTVSGDNDVGRMLVLTDINGKTFGSLTVDLGRGELFDQKTGRRLNIDTPRKEIANKMYELYQLIFDTGDHLNFLFQTLPLSHGDTPECVLVFVHRAVNGDPGIVCIAVPLLRGGRDALIQTMAEQLENYCSGKGIETDMRTYCQEARIDINLGKEPQLNRYFSKYQQMYRFQAKTPAYFNGESATWLLCKDPCFCDSTDTAKVNSIMFPNAPIKLRNYPGQIESTINFLVAADVQA